MKTIKLVALLIVSAFMFNACTEEEIAENTYPFGNQVFYQAAFTNLEILAYERVMLIQEYGDDHEMVQENEEKQDRLTELMDRIDAMDPLRGYIDGGVFPIFPPVPIPCGEEAIGINCMPSVDLSNLGLVIEGFQEIVSEIRTPGGVLVGATSYYDTDFLGQIVSHFETDGYLGDVIVENEIIMEGGFIINIRFSAHIN